MPEKEKPVTYGQALSGEYTFKEYVDDCYERNKDGKCSREVNAHALCSMCPKEK